MKCVKPAKNGQNRRIQPKYRAHHFENSFIAMPVPKNPMLEKRILDLSPIGKKLGGPPESYGRHLGFWAPGAKRSDGHRVTRSKSITHP